MLTSYSRNAHFTSLFAIFAIQLTRYKLQSGQVLALIGGEGPNSGGSWPKPPPNSLASVSASKVTGWSESINAASHQNACIQHGEKKLNVLRWSYFKIVEAMKNCHYHHPIHTLCSATSPTMPSALPKGPQGGSSRSIIVEDDTITAPTTVSARQ